MYINTYKHVEREALSEHLKTKVYYHPFLKYTHSCLNY